MLTIMKWAMPRIVSALGRVPGLRRRFTRPVEESANDRMLRAAGPGWSATGEEPPTLSFGSRPDPRRGRPPSGDDATGR
jgi:hypothetical protein